MGEAEPEHERGSQAELNAPSPPYNEAEFVPEAVTQVVEQGSVGRGGGTLPVRCPCAAPGRLRAPSCNPRPAQIRSYLLLFGYIIHPTPPPSWSSSWSSPENNICGSC